MNRKDGIYLDRKVKIILPIIVLVVISAATALIFIFREKPENLTDSFSDIKKYLQKNDEWYQTDEAETVADAIVKYQLKDGGWRKDWANPDVEGSWAKSTIDNDATTSEIYILAKMYGVSGKNKYKKAAVKGIDLLLDGQYENGGWPQVFGEEGSYHTHITFNDYAMIHVMNLLTEVSEKSGDFSFIDAKRAERAENAVQKGIRCILDTQIVVRGVKTAWCQQYDENTLEPAKARAFEYPSICAAESVGIVQYLKSVKNKTDEINESIEAAKKWMEDSMLTGIKFVTQGDDKVVVEDPDAPPIWARFYEIETNRPFFADRDGSIHYDVSEISKERRTGYAWYGDWCKKIID